MKAYETKFEKGKMTGVKKVTYTIALLLQLHLIQCQWFYPGYSYPCIPYGCTDSGQPNTIQQPAGNDPTAVKTQTISIPGNTYPPWPPYPPQPITIIVNSNEGKGKDKSRFEDFLPILLAVLGARKSDQDNRPPPPPPPPPPSPQYGDGGGGCCRCGCSENNNKGNKGAGGGGGITMNITIVLPKGDLSANQTCSD